jgi:type III pantothenate kinase
MMLCDIGNTTYHFYDGTCHDKQSVDTFDPQTITQKVYFISVNQEVSKKLASLENWIDLSWHVEKKNYYETMGIDRIMACEAVQDALIIDAGSAVTVDVVKEGVFEGGYIYPGLHAMNACYAKISPALAYSFNYELDLDIMPKNSQDAISYGYLKTLYSEVVSHKMPIILTGGDAKIFAKIFPHAMIHETLVFEGMKKTIQRANLC